MIAIASKTYRYAVIPSQGMYGSGDIVRVCFLTNDLARAKARAAKRTREYRDGMRRYGYTSGGYRVVAWDSSDRSVSFGWVADRMATVE